MSKTYDFEKLRLSVDGINDVVAAEAVEWGFSSKERPAEIDWLKLAEHEAQSLGMTIKDDPSPACSYFDYSLWAGDMKLIEGLPQALYHYVIGIKIALGMVARGNITWERVGTHTRYEVEVMGYGGLPDVWAPVFPRMKFDSKRDAIGSALKQKGRARVVELQHTPIWKSSDGTE